MAEKKPICLYNGIQKELQSGDTLPGGSGSPGGSDTHVQFNDGGSFGGVADLTFNKTTKMLYGAGSFKSNTGEYLTGTTKNFGGFSLASVIFGLNTIGNGLVVNDIAGARYVLGTGYYNLTFQKHKANTDTWYKSLVLNGDGADYYPQGISIFTGDNSEKLRLTEPGNLLMGRYTFLPGCVSNANFKTLLMESPVSSGSSLLALISSNINTSFIGATSGGMVFSLEGTAKNIDFRTGCGFADTDPLSSGTLRTRLQGNGYFGIGTGTDMLASMFTVKGTTNPIMYLNFDSATDNGVVQMQRQGTTKAVFGVYDPDGASFEDNDFYFGVRNSGGTWYDMAAFANDGSCFKIRNSIPIRFLGSSSGYTGLKAAATANSIDFTLPASDGASGNYLKTNGSGVLSWGDPSGFSDMGGSGIFGNGSDGDITISSNTYLSVDRYYNNLTINSGINLNANGFRIFVKGNLTLNGTIHNNGGSASGSTKGTKAGQGFICKKNGNHDGVDGSTTTGNSGTGTTDSCGGSGGAGGNSTYSGGNAGSASVVSENNGGTGILKALPIALSAQFIDEDLNPKRVNAGASGGSGSGDGTNAGGGSGAGGGGVIVCANTISGSGSITANGGNGGNGTGGNAAGGGAGGGGFCVVISNSSLSSLTVTANGGTGGSGSGSGGNGSNGSNGNIYKIENK